MQATDTCKKGDAACAGGKYGPTSPHYTETAPFFSRHVACPHSVLTAHLIDDAGQPTIAARDEVLSFFKLRLAS